MRSVFWVRVCAVFAFAMSALSSSTLAHFGGSEDAAETFTPVPAARAEEPADTKTACLCVGQDNSSNAERIKDVLRSPLHGTGLQFSDVPLEQIVAMLHDEYDIEFQIDTPALDDVGLAPDELLSADLRNVSLGAALRLLLHSHQLTYDIRDEVLWITTRSEAEMNLVTCVYDVRGLVGAGSSGTLVDAIIACIATDSWAEFGGGEAEIRSLPNGLLLVSQTPSNHDEIRQLIDAVTKLGLHPNADQLAGRNGPLADKDPVVTRNYKLLPHSGDEGPAFRKQVTKLIVESLPDEQWRAKLDSGETVLLTVFSDRVVLRHRRSVQAKVRTLLVESGLIGKPQAMGQPSGGSRGGIATDGRGGGGFFRPESESADQTNDERDAVEKDPFGF